MNSATQHLNQDEIAHFTEGRSLKHRSEREVEGHLADCQECSRAVLDTASTARERLNDFFHLGENEDACPDEDLCRRYVYSQVAPAESPMLDLVEQEIVEMHLEDCDICRADFKALASFIQAARLEAEKIPSAAPIGSTLESVPERPTFGAWLRTFLPDPKKFSLPIAVGTTAAAFAVVFMIIRTFNPSLLGVKPRTGLDDNKVLIAELEQLRKQFASLESENKTVAKVADARVAKERAITGQKIAAKEKEIFEINKNVRVLSEDMERKFTSIRVERDEYKMVAAQTGADLRSNNILRLITNTNDPNMTLRSRSNNALRGDLSSDNPIIILNMFATTVLSERPVFHWKISREGSIPENIEIVLREQGLEKAKRFNIVGDKWTPPQGALRLGKQYTWKLTYITDGVPGLTEPEATFYVFDANEVANIRKMLEQYPSKSVQRALILWEKGALDEGENALQLLSADQSVSSKDRSDAKLLLKQLRKKREPPP